MGKREREREEKSRWQWVDTFGGKRREKEGTYMRFKMIKISQKNH